LKFFTFPDRNYQDGGGWGKTRALCLSFFGGRYKSWMGFWDYLNKDAGFAVIQIGFDTGTDSIQSQSTIALL
jgi:hypothetical protein